MKRCKFKGNVIIVLACLMVFFNYLPLNGKTTARVQDTTSTPETYPPMLCN